MQLGVSEVALVATRCVAAHASLAALSQTHALVLRLGRERSGFFGNSCIKSFGLIPAHDGPPIRSWTLVAGMLRILTAAPVCEVSTGRSLARPPKTVVKSSLTEAVLFLRRQNYHAD